MNQILITGDEFVKKTKKVPKQKGEKKLLKVNTIVIFFAISIIILGICMIAGSIFANQKINETVEANKKPVVDVTTNDEDNTIEINVQHIRGIKSIQYRWNDEEATTINGNNSTQLVETIELIGGRNILTLNIIEENGQSVTYKKEFTAVNIPKIKLEAVANGVKVIATSEEKIDYITYKWDDGDVQKVEIGDTKYEGTISAPKGKHTLFIEVVDINNVKATKEQTVVGDTEPTLNITAARVDGKIVFVVDAEDDEGITTIEITQNEGTKQTFNVNDKTYHREIEMTEGVNKLLVTVYNKNGLSVKQGRQFRNE